MICGLLFRLEADSQGLSMQDYDKIHAYCLERELVNSALQGQESVDKTSDFILN